MRKKVSSKELSSSCARLLPMTHHKVQDFGKLQKLRYVYDLLHGRL